MEPGAEISGLKKRKVETESSSGRPEPETPQPLTPASGLNDWSKVHQLAHIIRFKQDLANNKHVIPTLDDLNAYARNEFGLYDEGCLKFSDGHDELSWKTRKLACRVSSFVVGLTCPSGGYRPIHCSGIIVEHNGITKILTSTYILGGRSMAEILPISILLPNRKMITGNVSFVDQHHNAVLIHADLAGMKTASFSTEFLELGDEVTAVGRHHSYKLVGSSGRVNIRDDHLDSDDLLSSSCSISEWGIGGPLIHSSSGLVVGINFFSKKGTSPFMPSLILLKCVKHLLDHGEVIRPWLGLKIRSLLELNIDELEELFLKCDSTKGLIVKEVMKGSPAAKAHIETGDVIISCNGTLISSPIQFAEIMFKLVETQRGKVLHGEKRNKKVGKVSVVIQRVSNGKIMRKHISVERFSPDVINRWPVLLQ